MLASLNKKALRDLWTIKGQMIAITLVMAAGIAIFIIMFGVLDSIKLTRDTYYERHRFAHVFSTLKRAPNSVETRLSEIDGISIIETRVVFGITLQMDNMPEPATGKIISYPDNSPPLLNQLYLRAGRYLQPNEDDAILADENFVNAHQLKLGDKVSVIMNGKKRALRIVGTVLSPEYVYSIAPGAMMPDSKRFGIFWMSRRSLEAAVNMKGAFNDVAIMLERSANVENVMAETDQILKAYGGLNAYKRSDQLSNFFVRNEIAQLQSMGTTAPIIFLTVAAFLINVVMSRQIATQREQIGMLKAVGYSDLEIALHYLKMITVVVAIGSVIGVAAGTWMGTGMTQMYTQFFHFPILKYSFSMEVIILAIFACAISGVVGTLVAIKNATKLPPAEAMRPESPTVFKQSWLQRIGLHQQLSFLTRIIVRQIERKPFRALLSSIAIAFALAILVFSFFMEDSMEYLLDVQYGITQREDVNIAFVEPKPYRALEEIRVLPNVLSVEPIRTVAVNFKHGHIEKRSSITGLPESPSLRRVIDNKLLPVDFPKKGIALNRTLANILKVNVGDVLTVEILEEKRQTLQVPVTEIVQEFIGLGAFIDLYYLNNLLDSSPRISGASLMIDHQGSATLYRRLKDMPAIIGLNIISIMRQLFEDIMAENLLKMVAVNVLFASFISFGVIYNTARITISERGRELANLRVLGLTRAEVAYLLFGELCLITLLAVPIGLALGYGLCLGMAQSMDSELFRIPVYLKNNTYAYAVAIVLISAIASFYMVWRQVDNIDLVSAQKGVE